MTMRGVHKIMLKVFKLTIAYLAQISTYPTSVLAGPLLDVTRKNKLGIDDDNRAMVIAVEILTRGA